MTREGRADLHIHSLASDGTASVIDILERAAGPAALDVIAITDHERIDSAVAARSSPGSSVSSSRSSSAKRSRPVVATSLGSS